jgi:hypothetical protein
MNLTPAAFSFRGLALPALIATSAISALCRFIAHAKGATRIQR